MITTTANPSAHGKAPGTSEDSSASRRGEWLGSWRVALRLGARDVRRHRGRSVLVVVMVAVPVMLLVAGNIIVSTRELTPVERLDYTLGQAQAHITYTGGDKAIPTPDPDSGTWPGPPFLEDNPATPIPGWGTTLAEHAEALGRLTGGTAYPVVGTRGRATIDGHRVEITAVAVDAAVHPSAPVHLISGRWPTAATEAAVTRAGLSRGLPEDGTITVEDQATGLQRHLTIVGIAESWTPTGSSPGFTIAADLVTLPPRELSEDPADKPETAAYLLERERPVDWAEVRRLADYGLIVTSRTVVLDPPPADQLPAELHEATTHVALAQAVTTAILAIGLLLETALLVGPAFAVSAARSRRTLALAASNGATTAQLRRTVLAQALVLGALAAVVGGALGVGGAAAVITWSRTAHPGAFFGPFDLPIVPLLIVIVCAVLSAIVAALIPARGLHRLDIVAVMRGQSVSPPTRTRTPVAGLVLAGVGSVLVFVGIEYVGRAQPELLGLLLLLAIMTGLVLLVVGALLLVPTALVLLARISRSAPPTWRMATRDAARQRGRASSTVAAILGVTALLSSILVAVASVDAHRERLYRPVIPMGEAEVDPESFPVPDFGDWLSRVKSAAAEADPALQVISIRFIELVADGPDSPNETASFFVALRTGCTPEQAMNSWRPADEDPRLNLSCVSLRASSRLVEFGSEIRVAGFDELVAAYELTDEQVAVLRDGGIIVNHALTTGLESHADPGALLSTGEPIRGQVDIEDGLVTFARGTGHWEPDGSTVIDTVSTVELPARTIHDDVLHPISWQGHTGALMTIETAAALDLPTSASGAQIIDPRGPISESAGDQLAVAIADRGLGSLYVERGFHDRGTVFTTIVLGLLALIILVATLVSTALSTAEMQPLMATFAAIGATRRTRRNLAAAQAISLGFLGALIGVLVGFVPGVAVARAATNTGPLNDPQNSGWGPMDPTVVIPWLPLGITVIVVPLIAGVLAWLAVRRAPRVTKRIG